MSAKNSIFVNINQVNVIQYNRTTFNEMKN